MRETLGGCQEEDDGDEEQMDVAPHGAGPLSPARSRSAWSDGRID